MASWCVFTEGKLCAVLGDYDPSLFGPWAQRACDQHLVEYERVEVNAPKCERCLEIKSLMVQFSKPIEEDTDESEW